MNYLTSILVLTTALTLTGCSGLTNNSDQSATTEENNNNIAVITDDKIETDEPENNLNDENQIEIITPHTIELINDERLCSISETGCLTSTADLSQPVSVEATTVEATLKTHCGTVLEAGVASSTYSEWKPKDEQTEYNIQLNETGVATVDCADQIHTVTLELDQPVDIEYLTVNHYVEEDETNNIVYPIHK